MRVFLLLLLTSVSALAIQIAPFRADVTPPVGAPLCGGLVKPAVGVSEPLLALGMVLLSDDKPVVLCAIDFCEIRGTDHRHWREVLAKAAGTSAERVALHSLHQHNAPLVDNAVQKLLPEIGIIDAEATEKALAGIAASIEAALKKPQTITHVSTGEAKVLQVAGNRRVQVVNGKVGKMRGSASKDAELRALPEGVIDPMLKTISFWNGDTKLAALHYYATHPMSYYGDGIVSHDFAGIARERRTQEDGVPHIYFTGCGGNIGAGKYNDGTPEMRPLLAERMHAAMVESEANARRVPLTTIAWRHVPVVLQPNPDFPEERILKVMQNSATSTSQRITAALRIGFIRHREPIPFTSLLLGDEVCLLHLPGESFVEYQLFAQQQRPGGFVCTASYGDGVTGYIPLEHSFEEGGYEPSQAYAAPESEKTMKETIERLLRPAAK
ncbi:hypothetical protein [Prosthecobacter sp.]|uniref:hypothetical protein n=1 Tax=Prosthecobacter sp. TaxID=1965333 RepID=UPI001D59CCF8|nr:hypothetical protein [Prosthecobacter sp.]MCB1276369.1 hypothetical protein [Prosthecobacter sp.]